MLIVPELEQRCIYVPKLALMHRAARVSKQGESQQVKGVGQLHSFGCLVGIEIIQARPTVSLGFSKV